MSIRVRDLLMQEFGSLRHEPTQKRIRGMLGGRTVVDSRRAVLLWEPKRIVPSYAVPAEDIDAEITPAPASAAGGPAEEPRLGDRPVYDPSVPFSVHTTEGEPVTVRVDGAHAAGLRLHDAELDGYVVLDFAAFDAWYEEDARNVAHPRDPFHRIDVVPASRHVRVELAGQLLAESSRPYLLFEPPLPVRYYLGAEDVAMDLLEPSPTVTYCAYKGAATYWSADGLPDVAWTYREPLHDAADVRGRIAFFNEHVDVIVDGERLERPVTPWSRR
jgi:uncharacterized protein (DUF427 family)